jgi:DNA-binding CsgD family transcriptional regulator
MYTKMIQFTFNDIFNNIPGYIGWKDSNGKYLGCNQQLAMVLQLKSAEQIVGLKDSILIDYNEATGSFHAKNDLIALEGNTVKGLHQSDKPYDGSFFYFIKKPLIGENKQIYGILFHCQPFFRSHEWLEFTEVTSKHVPPEYHAGHYIIGTAKNKFNLSRRELECLFYLLRGQTAKAIGQHLCLSKRTIESYIENIKAKFGCRTKAELCCLAYANEYHYRIPQDLVDKFMI